MTQVNFQSKSGSFFLGLAMRRIRKLGTFTWLGRTFQTGGECAEYICDSLCRRQIRAAEIVDLDPEPTEQQKLEQYQFETFMDPDGPDTL